MQCVELRKVFFSDEVKPRYYKIEVHGCANDIENLNKSRNDGSDIYVIQICLKLFL